MAEAKVALLALAVALATLGATNALSAPPCVIFVNPCEAFFNGSNPFPSQDCCNPVESVLKNQLVCVCNAFKENVFAQLNVDPSKVLELPQKCGFKFDMSNCTSPSPPSPGSVPPPVLPPPSNGSVAPPTPGSSPPPAPGSASSPTPAPGSVPPAPGSVPSVAPPSVPPTPGSAPSVAPPSHATPSLPPVPGSLPSPPSGTPPSVSPPSEPTSPETPGSVSPRAPPSVPGASTVVRVATEALMIGSFLFWTVIVA